MPALASSQCYQAVKRVDISPCLAALDHLAFVHAQHKGNYQGALSCDVVPKGALGPEIAAFIAKLDLGGRLGRALLRRLAPLQGIPPHTDEWMPDEADWRRFQVPLISHPDILMRWPDDGVEVHLEPGWLWEVRFDRLHEVVNPTSTARTHLQVDQIDATV